MAKPTETAPMRVVVETPAYWRVVFDYPPFNVVDADVFQALQDLLVRMDTTESLRVVVFESAIPDFYLAHFDLTGKLGNIMTAIGASGLPILMDTFVRLTKSPVSASQKSGAAPAASAASSSSPATCASRRARTRDSAIPSLVSVCILAVEAQSACPIWLAAAGRSKSFSAPTTSMAIARNDTVISTDLFPMPNWTASSTPSRAGSPPSIDEPSPPRRISSTRFRCRRPTGSSMPSLLLGQR